MKNYMSKFCLDGKIAFVTGGAGLIGSEVTKALASAGARTVILEVDRKKGSCLQKEIVGSGLSADYEYFDVTEIKDAAKSIKRLARKYGSIDIWVNAAYPRTKDWGNKVEKLNLRSWRKNVDMHLNSYSWISKEVALFMKEHGTKGTIVNFGSIYGVEGNDFSVYENTGVIAPMAYSAIKGGIINLTRYLASYFGKYGIRVNNICPGGIFDNQEKKFVKNYSKKVPLKRMGTSEEVASVVLFLASEAASYMNGATIMVDGGWTVV